MLPLHRFCRRARAYPRGFSLVELLVVIGIIALISGMLMPALLRSRRAAQATLCLSNLRQLGHFYYLYADANHDLIPLGTSGELPLYPDYYTTWDNFVWRAGSPSCAGGPFLLGKLVMPGSAKIFYCPTEAREPFQWEMFEKSFDRALAGEKLSIRTSYACRPTPNTWIADPEKQVVAYPKPMAKLVKQKHYALMAEYPQGRPFNHGESAAPYVHALFADGSVKAVPLKVFSNALEQYILRAPPYPPGMSKPSNDMAFDTQNEQADTIWQNMDRY
jgi:prepilin-type N-terminal cleavage/methylation domain-containing protein